MPDTITLGATTITPTIVLAVQTARRGSTVVHEIIGRANPDVTLRPAQLRSGRLEMGFAGPTAEADSRAAEALHSLAGVLMLASTDRPTLTMSYIVPESGSITRDIESETRNAWVVAVDFQEVAT